MIHLPLFSRIRSVDNHNKAQQRARRVHKLGTQSIFHKICTYFVVSEWFELIQHLVGFIWYIYLYLIDIFRLRNHRWLYILGGDGLWIRENVSVINIKEQYNGFVHILLTASNKTEQMLGMRNTCIMILKYTTVHLKLDCYSFLQCMCQDW